MQTIKNSGGNRALVAYLSCENVELEAFIDAILDTLGDDAVIDSGIEETAIETPRTVEINLSSGDWSRSLKIGNCGGDLIVGVYFYTAPQPVDTRGTMAEINEFFGEDIEPEPPSITSLVCNALQEAFPDGKVGASSFVISPEQIDFELDVE